MKRLRWLGRILLGLARELSDENAYRRHLAAHHRQHSAEEWRRFSEAHLRAKYSRAKCCGLALAVALSLSAGVASAQSSLPLPPLREQARIEQEWLRARLERILPGLMRLHQVHMWLVVCREYHEDPVFFSLVPPTVFSARRRTILVFIDRGPHAGIERLALGGGSNGGLYTVYRDPQDPNHELYGEAQWLLLRRLVEKYDPASIAINVSDDFAFADGLSSTDRGLIEAALGPRYMQRVVRAGQLVIEYLDVRLPEMLPYYRGMMETSHSLIRRAFSNEVITPGKTTDQDVVWWLCDQVRQLGLGFWFQPAVRIQRPRRAGLSFLAEDAGMVIQRGDVLHVDFGFSAMRLHTDTQHMGYVLREGESSVPAGIRHALAGCNRLQQLNLEHMKPGRTGNQVLAGTLAAMRAEGLRGSVYSHSIGDHGHAAGPLIGLWDHQQGVPGRGDIPLLPGTWFSIELSTLAAVPERGGQDLFVGLEEDAVLDEGGRMSWVLQPQTEFHLVK